MVTTELWKCRDSDLANMVNSGVSIATQEKKLPSTWSTNKVVMIAFLTCWYKRKALGFVPNLSYSDGRNNDDIFEHPKMQTYKQTRGCGIAADFFDELMMVMDRDIQITLACLVDNEANSGKFVADKPIGPQLAKKSYVGAWIAKLRAVIQLDARLYVGNYRPKFIAYHLDEQEFHGFGNLPIELRLIIWRFVMKSNQRTVELYYWNQSVASSCAPPVTLHVDQESRSVALKEYFTFQKGGDPTVFFHPLYDTLMFGARSAKFTYDLYGEFMGFFDYKVRNPLTKEILQGNTLRDNIQHLALSATQFQAKLPHISLIDKLDKLAYFPNLKTLTWVRRSKITFQRHVIELKEASKSKVVKATTDKLETALTEIDKGSSLVSSMRRVATPINRPSNFEIVVADAVYYLQS